MSDLQSLQDRVTQLEELFSHQERFLQQLNEVALQLRAECDSLKIGFQERIGQLEAVVQSQSATCDPDEKPPHY